MEAHPSWSPDGLLLSWASTPEGGFQAIKIWDFARPDDPPRSLNSGDWTAWSPAGDLLLVTLQMPNQAHLAGYYLDGTLALPMINLPGAVHGLAWGRLALPDPLPEALASQAGLTPTPLWQPVLANAVDLPPGRVQVVTLEGVQAQLPILQDRVDEGFYTLKARIAEWAGWDFLASLEQAYIPLTAPLNPGLMEDWLYTGRAFRFNTSPINAGWLLIVREDFGAQTYWRVYLRARFQDGSQGAPLKDLPWDLASRLSGDPVAYEQGGRLGTAVPPGYWVDFTRLAAALGWERLPSLSTWRVAYSSVRYDEFVLREGRDWMSAMLELYPKSALDTPTPVSSPTMTATPTDTPTSTPTYTRTPYKSRTPTATWTCRPTNTPTSTNTPRPTRTPTPTLTPPRFAHAFPRSCLGCSDLGACGFPGRAAMRPSWKLVAGMLMLAFLAAGCNLPAPTPIPALAQGLEIALTLTAVAPQAALAPSPSPVVALAKPVLPAPPQATEALRQVEMADPLEFNLPTAGAEPVSLWRPPLYPVPWEPTPNDHFYFTRPIAADQVNWPLARASLWLSVLQRAAQRH